MRIKNTHRRTADCDLGIEISAASGSGTEPITKPRRALSDRAPRVEEPGASASYRLESGPPGESEAEFCVPEEAHLLQ